MVRGVQCACAAVLAALALATESSHVADSADLIQVAARVRELDNEEPEKPKRSMKESLEKIQQLGHAWKEHVENRIAALDKDKTEKAKAREEAIKAEAAKHEAEEARELAAKKAADQEAAEIQRQYEADSLTAQKNAAMAAQRQVAEVVTRQEEEKREQELLAKREKFGDELTVIVKSPMGEFGTTVWDATRLQTLMRSVGHKLNIDYTKATFSVNGNQLDPTSTPKEVGMNDQDVVTVSGPEVEHAHSEALRVALNRKAKDEAAAAHAEYQQKVENRNEAKAAAARRERQLKEEGRVTLRFVHEEGGVQKKEVELAVKPTNWLQGSMDLVIKRLDLDPAKTRFQLPDQKFALGKDTPLSLGLKENTVIIVKTPWKKPTH